MKTIKRYSLVLVLFLLAACGEVNAPSYPAGQPTPTATTVVVDLPTSTAVILPPPGLAPTPECTNSLYFLDDLTIPDNTVVAPGSAMDKQWLVQNNGTCNWDGHYRLKLIGSEAMGAAAEQALYPARSGTQAALRIQFTAPAEAGTYVSEWQAYDPSGIPFGDSFFIKIIVQP
jgi:hypothetical protein